MKLLTRLGIIFVISLFFASCGDGSSSSGSGIGGTGITLVRGNVSSVNGQLVAHIRHERLQPDEAQTLLSELTEWAIPLSYAQSTGTGLVTVSGGGQSSSVNSSGGFELPNVTPSASFVLTFQFSGNESISLGIGEVAEGATVTVKNIAIDTKDSSAKPADIEVAKAPDTEDDISEDLDQNTEDHPEDEEDSEGEDDSEDDSEDDPEDEEDSDDSIDDVSNDDGK